MKLNIPPLGQRDERWKQKRLGTSSVTIGNYGCLLVCHSMMLQYYGHEDMDILTLNDSYARKDVFDQGSLINHYAAANIFGDITADELYHCYDVPCDLSKIDKYLAEKKPVIALVDFEPKPGVQTHFVLIKGRDEAGSYLCNDPWFGDETYFQARYGDDPAKHIFGLRLYSGLPKEEANHEDEINDLKDKINPLTEALAQCRIEVGQERGLKEDVGRTAKEFEGQRNKARGERDTATQEKEAMERTVKSLGEKINVLEEKDEVLRSEVERLREQLRASVKIRIRELTLCELLKTKYGRGGEKK